MSCLTVWSSDKETETDNQEKKKVKLKMDFFPDSTRDVYIMNAPHP